MSISVSPYNPTQQSGCRAKNPPDLVIASRAPTTKDYGYFLGALWLYEGTGVYSLVSIIISPSSKSANWISLGASAGLFNSLTVSGSGTLTGNLGLTGVASKLSINASAPSTSSVGTTSAMSSGAVTVSSSAVTTSSIILYSRKTLGTAQGNVSITAQSSGSFTLTSTAGTETSTFNYLIIN